MNKPLVRIRQVGQRVLAVTPGTTRWVPIAIDGAYVPVLCAIEWAIQYPRMHQGCLVSLDVIARPLDPAAGTRAFRIAYERTCCFSSQALVRCHALNIQQQGAIA